MALTPLRLDDAPPCLLFLPPGTDDVPLVLLGHGAHLSKDDPVMQILAKTLCRGIPAAVALMDCPGHGERRDPSVTDDRFEADIARRMSDAANYQQVTADWLDVERAACAVPRVRGPVGYAGFSMGAMFGLAIAHALPSVRAAAFALGGLTADDARNRRIREGAAALADREILMLNMTRDEHFPIDGALEVFESIPGPKRMGVWAGTHVDIPPEAIQQAVEFFRRTLS
ncbi:MAG TPA: alpha/beta fold hydrolase [Acidimicrobiia bacterium]|nr:alpha/beta fold hydrolase [Acidimicrobiia bacterium]